MLPPSGIFKVMKKWVLMLAALAFASANADELEDFVHKEREARRIPGLVVATIKDGKVDRVVTSGKASLDLDVPVKRNTAFEIGSMTKAFTAELIMILVEEGKVKLDEPIGTYLENTPETWKDITVRKMLTHTSGLPNYTSLRPAIIVNGERTSYDDLFDLVKNKQLDFKPGSKYAYSNTNYYFLGKIIEKTSGETFEKFLQEKILTPLGMENTTPQRARGIIANRAVGYMQIATSYSIVPYLDSTGGYAAGSLVSTVDDLAKWDKALLEGKLLKPESYGEMYKRVPIDGGVSTYGFGWDVSEIAGHRAIQHGGGTGGFSTFIVRLPDDNLSVVVLSNLAQADVASIAHGVAKLVEPGLVEKPIRDPDASISKRHREVIDKIMDGTIQRTPFEENTANELFPDLIAQARTLMQSYGKLEKFELLEHKHEPKLLTRRYRMIFEKARFQLVVRENEKSKIVAIFLLPD
jgi:CubicO group peptidase (beta-lactamase class C family)